MATVITGRNYEIPPNIRKMLESKLAKIEEKLFDDVIDVRWHYRATNDYGNGEYRMDNMVARLDREALEEDVTEPKERQHDHPAHERERQAVEQDAELVELVVQGREPSRGRP